MGNDLTRYNLDPSPWHPITDPLTLKHLGKLGEECAEASGIIFRIIIQGVDEKDPDTGVVNRLTLQNECADVMANIELVTDLFRFDLGAINDRIDKKKKFQRLWHAQADKDNTQQVVNHEEAEQLAHFRKDASNLARCYIDLLAQLRLMKEAKT